MPRAAAGGRVSAADERRHAGADGRTCGDRAAGAGSPRTVLLTLGRLPKALDLARSFARGGWRVVVAEPFRRHLVGASNVVARSHVVTAPAVDRERYLGDLLRVIDAERVQLVVPVSEEAMHVAFLRDRLPGGVRLYTMPPEALLAVHHKGRFVERCRDYGLAVPDSAMADAPRAAEIARAGRFVTKPAYSCSGRGVRFHAPGAGFPADPGLVVQSFVEGALCSTCTQAHDGRVLATVVYRGAVMSGSVAVCFERIAQPAVEEWVRTFVARTGWTGFVAFDFVVDAEGRAHAIECNPRTTSGLHFLHPDDLARGVVAPEDPRPVRFRDERTLMQFWACLTELGNAGLDRARAARVWRAMRTARDVTWSPDDPWPLLSMPWTSWTIISMARARGVPFGEVATLDVGWYEDRDRSATAA